MKRAGKSGGGRVMVVVVMVREVLGRFASPVEVEMLLPMFSWGLLLAPMFM